MNQNIGLLTIFVENKPACFYGYIVSSDGFSILFKGIDIFLFGKNFSTDELKSLYIKHCNDIKLNINNKTFSFVIPDINEDNLSIN